ncbi:hypothetical protein GCM10011365_12040 [Marinicella pacifica]|uniref:ABC-type transport auxiliary lipoprotein component domain-containing protein n=1 Tax=Marinicella pacifica TaxID=1171543 RepID=A0A917CM81_9GAMM|nr:ABC-type transport auxiliary lipoprotein family protein [Marinicella pacifica]GGF92423.1 hypothetical protein GCM10011365_12040 [Marinicella pacifica]
MNKLIILATSLLLLSACSNQPAVVKKYYRLSSLDNSQLSLSPEKRPSVVITRPKGMSILAGRPMVATVEDGALVQLNHHYWLESPTLLVQQILSQWAEQHWQQIKTHVAFDKPIERLDSEILAFEKDGNQAKVSLHFILTAADGHIILDQTLSRQLTISGEGYAGFVHSINNAVNQILTDLSEAINNLS